MTHPNPSTALARTAVDELVRNGVGHLALGPGSRSASVAMAAASHPGMQVHVEIDERSAGFLALGIGKAGPAPAAVLTTSGTAAANLLPAVVEADRSETPLLVLTADRPPELRDVGANQTIDQVGLYGDAVRWFVDVGVPEDRGGSNPYWRSTVCRAVASARGGQGPPGPVHLNLPFREPLVPASDDGRVAAEVFTSDTDGRADGGPWIRNQGGVQAPAVPVPEELAVLERGVVVAGSGRWGRAAAELARSAGWPLLAEAGSGVREPETISTAHHLLSYPDFASAHLPDVAVVVGSAPVSRATAAWLGRVPRLISADPHRWRDPDRTVTDLIPGAPTWPYPEPRPPGEWAVAWLKADEVARLALDRALDALLEPTEPRTARDTARSVPDGRALVVASSMPVRDLDWFMPPRRIRVYANRGASGIDGFVSTTLGVAAASAGPVTALAGDLSILHDANGFLVRPRPEAVFVVINNDGGGIFSFLPQARFPEHFEQVFGTPHHRSFERLAAFHDLGHRRVTAAADLVGAIEEGRKAGGVHLVEVVTDRAANVEVHRELTAAVHRALDQIDV